jgi:hypothetical protein
MEAEYANNGIQIVRIIVSLFTPILILIFGLKFSKSQEKGKLEALKEKEWQVKWAELFLNQAIQFNDNVSDIVCLIKKIENFRQEIPEIEIQINKKLFKLAEIEWHIQNYIFPAENEKNHFLETQKKILNTISKIYSEKGRNGNFEDIRDLQIQYNKSMRETHKEIMKSEDFNKF